MGKTMAALMAICVLGAAGPASARGAHSSGSHANSAGGVHTIRAHTTRNGTHVAASHATNPDRSKADNFSSKGNVNPYTGKAGTKDPNK